jgi:hypothetical protein
MDTSGNNMTSEFDSSFTTDGQPDTTPPSVDSVSPFNGAIDVPVTANISISFSEQMDTGSVEGAFTLSDGTEELSGTYSWSGETMTFQPGVGLSYSKIYYVSVGTGAMDTSGNNMTSEFDSSFTTDEEPPSSYLLIDHTAVQDFDQIPDYWLERAKELTMHYAHTSHGMQIVSGLKYLEENIDAIKYSVAYLTFQSNPALPPQENPPAHRICDTGWKPADYWATEVGRNETRRFADSGLFDYSMFAWCGDLSGSADLAEYIDEYLNVLDIFEQEYPNMRFIYQTGHTDGYPSYSRLRENNNRIREYCRNNGKVLYDFADIESWDPDGNYYEDNYNCSWCEEWCNNHPDECVNLPVDCNSGIPTCCPHTHGYNCYIKAKAYWYMMARLAGWDGVE